MPRTWESRRPMVTASWLTVPRPPRRLSGAISLIYMGTREVLSPVAGWGGKRRKRISTESVMVMAGVVFIIYMGYYC